MVTGDPYAWLVREMTLFTEQEPVHMSGLPTGSKGDMGAKSRNPLYKAHLEFSGTYDQIGTFVRDLENKFATSEIQSLSVSGNANDKDARHNATLDIALRVLLSEPPKKAESTKKI